MSIGEISDLAQTIGLFVSLLFTAIFSVITLRKADSAERRTEQNTTLLASQLEDISQALRGQTNSKTGVRWSLDWVGGDTYQIENIGDETAESVSIRSHETLPLLQLPEMPISQMDPTESATFMAARTLGTTDATITIAYRNLDGEEKSWSRALPFKK